MIEVGSNIHHEDERSVANTLTSPLWRASSYREVVKMYLGDSGESHFSVCRTIRYRLLSLSAAAASCI